MKHVVLLRGVNVGGKNKVPMALLRQHLEQVGYKNVQTYINSGNVVLESTRDAEAIGASIENLLLQHFAVDSSLIKVHVLDKDQYNAIIDNKPKGFGEQPEAYHSDVIFLMGIDSQAAMQVFNPKEGVDTIWQGDGVIYSQRVSTLLTKSRLNRIIGTPEYDSMTIRNWNTTIKLLDILNTNA